MKTKVIFHTNIDEAQRYVSDLNANYNGDVYPVNGERIEFIGDKRIFELEVVAVRFTDRGMVKEIELHVPSVYGSMSLQSWIDRFFKKD